MSSPKMILNAFWFVTVKTLNSYRKCMKGEISCKKHMGKKR